VSVRQGLAAVAFVALIITGVDWQFLLLPFIDRSPLIAEKEREADQEWWPVYPRFLDAVRAHTVRGQSIVLIVPPMSWRDGYDYAFYRASYFLAGRTVLPVVDDDAHGGRLLPENFQKADWIAVWQRPFPGGKRPVVWRGEGGMLLRRE
jgi:hypothetical protein